MAVSAVAVFISGCGRGVVAKVNNRKITENEYYSRLEHLPVPGPNGQKVEAGVVVLQRLIDEELVLRLAESKGVPPTDQQVDERYAQLKKGKSFKDQLKQAGITPDQVKQMLRVEQAAFNLQTRGVKVSDAEVNDYYKKNLQTQFTQPEHAFVAVILTKTHADAEKAMSMLSKLPFDTVARNVSMDASSKTNGGKLPRAIVRGDRSLPKNIQDAIFSTAVNKYTEPLPFTNGEYVIFQVLQHDPKTTQQLDPDLKYNIRQTLMVQKGTLRKNNLDQDLAEFRKTASIQVFINRYKDQLTQKAK
jgi:foldase protein PrsA